MILTQERLKEILTYDPITGLFTRFISRGCYLKGEIAGTFDLQSGYIKIEVDGKSYQGHRLVWLYMTGNFPIVDIDHKDRNRSNNKWSNLREANKSENGQNQNLNSANKSGYKGVCWHKGKKLWVAQITIKQMKHQLGSFKTAEEAGDAYKNAKLKLHTFNPTY